MNPRLALIFKPGRMNTLKLLGGRAFRAPSPYELHYNDNGVTQEAPESLAPENILSGEIEYTRRLGEVSTLALSAFGHRIDNIIDIVERDDGIVHAVCRSHSPPVFVLGASMGARGRAGGPRTRRGRYPIAGRGDSTVAVGGRRVRCR